MSLKRTFHSKEHRERSQPEHRKEFGFLEKKKDYRERAKDYHQKQDAINQLREKARLRNPDEFYFRMISTKTENGIHQECSTAQSFTPEQEKLFKTQDLAYVRQRLQRDQSRCNKIMNLLACAPESQAKRRVVFVEDAKMISSGAEEAPSNPNLLKPSQELTKELNARRGRIQKLQQVEQKMKLKEDLASKEPKFIAGTSPSGLPIYKWRAERKR